MPKENQEKQTENAIPKPRKERKYKTFSETFGDGSFYPDLPKIPFTDLLNQEIVVLEAKILRDFNSQFGKHDCALIMAFPVNDQREEARFTTICSGQVVLERIDQSIKRRLLPLVATPTYVDEKYYNLL